MIGRIKLTDAPQLLQVRKSISRDDRPNNNAFCLGGAYL